MFDFGRAVPLINDDLRKSGALGNGTKKYWLFKLGNKLSSKM